jgi:hypothetical protein
MKMRFLKIADLRLKPSWEKKRLKLLVPNVSDEQMKAKPKQGAANCGSD